MPKFRITKYITAKNLTQALKSESGAEVDEIARLEANREESEGTANTHAIGFEIRPGNEYESVD
jgi:hypothetical protein